MIFCSTWCNLKEISWGGEGDSTETCVAARAAMSDSDDSFVDESTELEQLDAPPTRDERLFKEFQASVEEEEEEGVRGSSARLVVVLGAVLLGAMTFAVLGFWGYGKNAHEKVPSNVLESFQQGRPYVLLGKSKAYHLVNRAKMSEKLYRMHLLEKIRSGHCGGFDKHVASNFTSSDTNWRLLDEKTAQGFCPSNNDYRIGNCTTKSMSRSICSAPHPAREKTTVTIERFGPFYSRGGTDWSVTQLQGVSNLGNLTEYMKNRTINFFAGMLVPVHVNGTIIGYPPLHIHHAHVYAYGDRKERRKKIPVPQLDGHQLIFQSHGDTYCQDSDGGVACMLRELDNGEAFQLVNSQSGISADWEVNDVRPKARSDEGNLMEWYFEVVLVHSIEQSKPTQGAISTKVQPVTFMGFNNPCWGGGPCTYAMPLDASSVLAYYNYSHMSVLGPGLLKNFIVHTHQTVMDSIFVFKGAGVGTALEKFRRDAALPIILDCHGEQGGFSIEQAKREIFSSLPTTDAELVCEATKPSVHFECSGHEESQECHAYDRRLQLNCLESVHLEPLDTLWVVAFNRAHKPNGVERNTAAFNRSRLYDGLYATYQHSIFRGDFLADPEHQGARPPATFSYAKWVRSEKLVSAPTCLAKGIPISFQPSL